MDWIVIVTLLVLNILKPATTTSQSLDEFRRTPPNPVLEGDIVTVVCSGQGVSLRWHVNSQQISNTENGIYNVVVTHDDSFTMWNSTLVTTATVARNITRITCSFSGSSTGHPEESTVIIIAGPPLIPSTFLVDAENGTVLQLSWEEPYAPTLYPITGYQVLIANGSNVLVDSFLNSSLLHYDFTKPENYSTCEMIEFAVSAMSVLGFSNISTEIGMFPRIPDATNLRFRHEVVFKRDGTPRLTVSFHEPEVCDLQDPVNYTMELLNDRGMVVVTSGLQIAKGFQGTVMITFNDGLPENAKLLIRVSFSHSAMSWTSQAILDHNITIPTFIIPPQTDSPAIPTSIIPPQTDSPASTFDGVSQTQSSRLDSTTSGFYPTTSRMDSTTLTIVIVIAVYMGF